MKSTRGARMVLAAAAATFVLVVWGAFSHMIIIRGVGYAAIPNEPRFVDAAMQPCALPPSLYAFPAPPDWRGEEPTAERMTAWEASFRAGPSGMLVVRPRGEGSPRPGRWTCSIRTSAVEVVPFHCISSAMMVLLAVASASDPEAPGPFKIRVGCLMVRNEPPFAQNGALVLKAAIPAAMISGTCSNHWPAV